jgi:hypothetical protein
MSETGQFNFGLLNALSQPLKCLRVLQKINTLSSFELVCQPVYYSLHIDCGPPIIIFELRTLIEGKLQQGSQLQFYDLS